MPEPERTMRLPEKRKDTSIDRHSPWGHFDRLTAPGKGTYADNELGKELQEAGPRLENVVS